jgi:hypothetical protein
VIKSKMACGQLELLVCWSEQAASDATWVTADNFRTLYPSFPLADKLLLQQGETMCVLQYQRRRPS